MEPKQGREKHCSFTLGLSAAKWLHVSKERRGKESRREKKPTSATSLHTSMCGCCFYVKPDFDVCESGPMAGAGYGAEVGVVEPRPNEKIDNSGLLCLFTLSPSCLVGRERQNEGGRRGNGGVRGVCGGLG